MTAWSRVAAVVLAVGAAAGCGSPEGTVVAKTVRPAFDYTCQVASIDIPGTGSPPISVPVYGTCTEPPCNKLSIREVGDDPRQAPDEVCVTDDEYRRTTVGSFRHRPTD